jgi:hypothetical protein
VLGTRGVTVRAHALAAFADLHALEERRTSLEHALATVAPDSAEYGPLMERYMAVCEEWDHRGRYDTEAEADAVLCGLGFRPDDLERDCAELSAAGRCGSRSRSSSSAVPTSSCSTSRRTTSTSRRGRGWRSSSSSIPGRSSWSRTTATSST